MFDERAFRRVAKDLMKMRRTIEKFRTLYKTPGGHLTDAAKAIIPEGLKAGMSKVEIADLLQVHPSAISYHTR